MGGGHDEREQTLNQLLVEMDGFGSNTGVIVMAATNRPETLDPALLRPGRFDRQVVVPLPEYEERKAILEVHAKHKKLSPDVDLHVLPSGSTEAPNISIGHARISRMRDRMESARAASDAYLTALGSP